MTEKPYTPPATPELIDANQTKFAAEEPLFENPAKLMEEKKAKIKAKKEADPKKKMLLMGVGALAFILLLLAVLIFFKSRQPKATDGPEIINVTQEIEKKSQLEEKLLGTKQDLERANPTLQDLPFPPVDLNLRID